MNEAKQAFDMLRDVYEEGVATINGRDYQLTTITHNKRKKIYGVYSRVGNRMKVGDYSFLTDADFAEVETILGNAVTFEGQSLSKRNGHWDDYPEDYLLFIPTMLGAFSFPFLRGLAGG